mgnify:FL=1
MKVKAKQRTGVVKITGKQVPSVRRKGGMVLNAGKMPRISQKMLVAKSGERKSSAYGYIYAQEEEDTARAMSVLEKYAKKR